MALEVRPAHQGDAAFLAWCILAAGRAHLDRGWYDIALGLDEPGCLDALNRLVLTRAPSWWRYDRWLVAERDGALAGGCAAFGSSEFAQSEPAISEATQSLGWTTDDVGEVWRRGAYVFSCAFTPEDHETWVIENVAVRPEHRGHGVAPALLERAFAVGRGRGFRDAQISFVIGNAPAERAYSKAGFRFVEERRHPDFQAAVGAPGLMRYGIGL